MIRLRLWAFEFTVVLLAAALGVLSPALAQMPNAEPKGKLVEPPANLPKPQKGDPTRNLDFLFEALKLAPDDSSAKAIEQRIWAQWFVTKSDTATILMTRVKTAVEAKDLDLAIKLLDSLVKIRPDYVEAWNRRATVYYLRKDYGRAMADIREVLRREPRHFGAMSGLGLILQEVGDDKHALDIYRRALSVYPRLERIPDLVKTLTEKVEGRDI